MDRNEQATAGTFPDDAWKAAKFCGPNGGNCVEVNLGASGVTGIRDSKSAPGPVLVFGEEGWGTFLADTKVGR
jgi:hypothetical protein